MLALTKGGVAAPVEEELDAGAAHEAHREALAGVQPWMMSALTAIRRDIGRQTALKSLYQRVVRSVRVDASTAVRGAIKEPTAVMREDLIDNSTVEKGHIHEASPHHEADQGPHRPSSATTSVQRTVKGGTASAKVNEIQ